MTSISSTFTDWNSDNVSYISCVSGGFLRLKDAEPDAIICTGCKLKVWDIPKFTDLLAFHKAVSINTCPVLHKLSLATTTTNNLNSQLISSTATVMTNPEGASIQELYKSYSTEHAAKINCQMAKEAELFPQRRDYKHEIERAKTFKAEYKGLAAAGLLQEGDIMLCVFCTFRKPMIKSLNDIKSVINQHNNHNGEPCNQSGNVPMLFKMQSLDNNNSTSMMMSLGINTEGVKTPDMAIDIRRKDSFLTFPAGCTQGVEDLVKAGYYYQGDHDSVVCFACGIKSDKWTVNETPLQRHIRTNSHCSFVMGTFADQIEPILAQYGAYKKPEAENVISEVQSRQLRPRIHTSHVQKSLDMGLLRTDVVAVISERIKKSKPDFRCVAEIVRDVYEFKNSKVVPPITPIILPKYEVTQIVISAELPESSNAAPAANEPAAEDEGAAAATNEPAEDEGAAATSSQNEQESVYEFRVKNRQKFANDIKQQFTCKICFSDIVGICFLPCGHLICCVACSAAMSRCPLCQQDIKGTIRCHI